MGEWGEVEVVVRDQFLLQAAALVPVQYVVTLQPIVTRQMRYATSLQACFAPAPAAHYSPLARTRRSYRGT